MHIPRTQSKDGRYQLDFALCWICMPWLGILLDPDFLFDDAPSHDTPHPKSTVQCTVFASRQPISETAVGTYNKYRRQHRLAWLAE
jgi:hypothetical protein